MSDLERSGSRLPRRTREQRAYRLALAGGGFAVVAIVGFVLAILGVIGGWVPFLAGLIALVCGLMFRRTVGG